MKNLTFVVSILVFIVAPALGQNQPAAQATAKIGYVYALEKDVPHGHSLAIHQNTHRERSLYRRFRGMRTRDRNSGSEQKGQQIHGHD